MHKNLNKAYWEERYQKDETGWDVGTITTPLKKYIDQITNKEIKILIPGAGNGHEVDYLIANGFTNIIVIDIAKQPLEKLKKRHPFLEKNFIEKDFFTLQDTFDLVLEQTFFCAIDPSLRVNYEKKMTEILNPNGKIAGLLFQFPLTEDGPPFGGNYAEYVALFSKNFTIKTLETAYNSIKPRENKELFFIFEKN